MGKLPAAKVPVPSFLNRSSSNVLSHTMSSHIWQYRAPLLESTSCAASVCSYLTKRGYKATHTESVLLLGSVVCPIVFGDGRGALQA